MSFAQKLLLAASLCLPFAPLLAQDTGVRDSVYFGENGKAYGYFGNVYRVPIYVVTDQVIGGISLGMEFGLNLSSQVYDSLSEFGSLFMLGDFFDLGGPFVNTNGIHPPNPDTVGVGAAAYQKPLTPGRYKFCDLYFTGTGIGQQIEVDSAYFPPAGSFLFAPPAGYGYTPAFVGGFLTIEAGQPDFLVLSPTTVSGDAGSEISFQAEVISTNPPETIVLDSIIDVDSDSALSPLPATSGTNPLTVVWTPTYDQFGDWNAFFTATDSDLNTFQFTILIRVNYVRPPCEVLRGDPNCDEKVNITDVVYIIQYIFAGGPAPGCNPK